MANVGTAPAGKTLIGTGNLSSPTFTAIGTLSGLTAHGVLIAQGNSAFVASAVGNAGQIFQSSGAGLDPVWADPPFTSAATITGNSGVATFLSNNLNLVNSNTNIKIIGSASTLTQDFGLTTNLILGANAAGITSGTNNVAVGQANLNGVTSGNNNTAIGFNALKSVTTGFLNTAIGSLSQQTLISGNGNVSIGYSSLALNTGDSNTALGYSAMGSCTTGSSNCAVGNGALGGLSTGTFNIGIGGGGFNGAGLTGSDSNNIMIGHPGVSGDNNIGRIGVQGTGIGQIKEMHLAGALITTSGRIVNTTTPGAYPYTTLTTDYIILVDTSSARTINLIASPVTGTIYRIKDNVGSAAANNITITPAAGNIDGSASYVIGANWGTVDLCYTGTKWVTL
jgi:hypothetical protein